MKIYTVTLLETGIKFVIKLIERITLFQFYL